MADLGEENDGDVYVYKAPEQPPAAPPSDETGEIVGAILACVVIIGVLVFLWKMLERKRTDMANLQEDPEEGSSDEERTLPNSPKPDPVSPKRGFLPNLLRTKRERDFNTEQLPNAVSDESKEDPEPIRPLEELVLPNLSPITSSIWSQKVEGSGDTGYNSGIYRKDPVLRRRLKHSCFDQIDLDLEHPRDILDSLKSDNKTLLQEMEDRNIKSKQAISGIGVCLELLSSVRKTISSSKTKKRDGNEEVKEFLRKARAERKRHELQRKLSLQYCYIKQQTKDQRDAFVSMQEWFDGLRLRPQLRHIAEDLFLLRSKFLNTSDRNQYEKELIKEAIVQIEKCQADVAKVKSIVMETQQQLLASREATNSTQPEKVDEKTVEVDKPAEKSKPSSKFRIKLPLLLDKLAPFDGFAKSGKQTHGERCATCKQLVCKCSLSTSVKPQELVMPSAELGHCSTDVRMTKFVTSTPKTVAPAESKERRANPQEHNLTLKLIEVTAKESRDDAVSELSEREVRKALNRVPFVTSVKEIGKGNSNEEWILDVVSAQPRLANVRFNCRGRTYVIGMIGDVNY